jgi:hypothetical protein
MFVKNVIVTVPLYDIVTWSLTRRLENRLRVPENRVARRYLTLRRRKK